MEMDYKTISSMRAPSLREAVTIFFRDAILSGGLQAGETLPSSRELGKLLGTSYPNVHHGLTPLVKEGLITRDRKAGTTVNSRERRIECIVLYVCLSNLDDSGSFQRILLEKISSRLKNLGIVPRLVVDNESFHGLMQIQEWARLGQIQGLIMPRGYDDEEICLVMKRLPIPVSYPGAKSRMKIDSSNLNDLALKGLKRQGCKTVGLVNSMERYDESGNEDPFYTDFKAKAEKYGLICRPEWIESVVSRENYLRSYEMAMSFAFSATGRILSLAEKPDGLFVFSENLITGVMMGIMKSGINIPDDIKLVLHRNLEVEIPVFSPCVIIGLSITEVANALIDNIMTQFNGEKSRKTVIKYRTMDFNI